MKTSNSDSDMKRNMGETIWVTVTKMFLFSFWLCEQYFIVFLTVNCGHAANPRL